MTRQISGMIVALALAATVPAAAAQGAPPAPAIPCTATTEKPVAICFASQPLTIEHCRAGIRPHFTIDIWHPPESATVPFRYWYELLANGRGLGEHYFAVDAPGGYPFTEPPNLEEREHALRFEGPASYSLRVTVTPQGLPARSERSPEVQLTDRPRIRGVAVGVSAYSDARYNLNFPDEDARTFHSALTALLGPSSDTFIDLRTTANGDNLRPNELLQAIKDVARRVPAVPDAKDDPDSVMCGPNDWFVFYYSGHGIVSANDEYAGTDRRPSVTRYLSTTFFDPAHVSQTAVAVTGLASTLVETLASNVLVILDSCFSGFFTTGSRNTAPGGRSVDQMTPSGKVMYVADKKVVSYPLAGSGDTKIFPNKLVELEEQARHGLVLSAASATQQAEEGPVRYNEADGQLNFERGSVATNKGKSGYGLFTFAWLANLLAQLPGPPADTSTWLKAGRPRQAGQRKCQLDFYGAAQDAISDIGRLARNRNWSLQEPEARPTQTLPQPLPCLLPAGE